MNPEESVEYSKIEKDFKTKALIKEALSENDFLKNLNTGQMKDIVDYMDLIKVRGLAFVGSPWIDVYGFRSKPGLT